MKVTSSERGDRMLGQLRIRRVGSQSTQQGCLSHLRALVGSDPTNGNAIVYGVEGGSVYDAGMVTDSSGGASAIGCLLWPAYCCSNR